jgi:hypothetical protein
MLIEKPETSKEVNQTISTSLEVYHLIVARGFEPLVASSPKIWTMQHVIPVSLLPAGFFN